MAQINRSPIRFCIQRRGMGPESDDELRIEKTDARIYTLTYHDKDSDYKTRVVLDEYSTLRHIQTTMELLCADQDPFEYIQVDIPGFPSIQLEIGQLKSQTIRDNIFTNLKMCMRYWPETIDSQRIRTQYSNNRQSAHSSGDA